MIGRWLAQLDGSPDVGAGASEGVPLGSLVLRVDIPPLPCDRLCAPESLPSTGVAADAIAWAGALLIGGAVLIAHTLLTRHPIGRPRR
ncbi:LPXTG-motif cell wall anchor domain-containing protein [Agromyces sp. CF514]|uniref:LPXTG cell wall anchor domain-containing protein n=1 Tax=Agromyces sp. CF514 TaxID=1881031 RepID=UPI0008EEEF0A|nr:LPXTG cell wall anchor domain-containing protein [Agromyces sp. CF514]SFR70317.1 LPXTG-motif cell wall anchor domain-containing protein [Agromyces sp. CF514]